MLKPNSHVFRRNRRRMLEEWAVMCQLTLPFGKSRHHRNRTWLRNLMTGGSSRNCLRHTRLRMWILLLDTVQDRIRIQIPGVKPWRNYTKDVIEIAGLQTDSPRRTINCYDMFNYYAMICYKIMLWYVIICYNMF